MDTLVYYNGVYSSFWDASIPLTDRSIFFGDAVYDVVLGTRYGGLYQLDRHIKRLTDNASFMGFDLKEDIQALAEGIAKMADAEFYSLYIQLSRVGRERNHTSATPERSNVLIVLSEAALPDPKIPVSAITCEDKRYSLCNIKTVNLLPSVLASEKAEKMGADEAIFIRNKIVTEGAKTNVFIINDNVLTTHPSDHCILPGITRENLIIAAKQLGLSINEEKFTKHDLFSADEILITSTTKFVRRVHLLDGTEVGMKNGEIYAKLSRSLRDDFELHAK